MGEWIHLKAADGFDLKAWRAAPSGAPKGAVVVIQEIFGVNHHIRAVADRLGGRGLSRHRAGGVRPRRARRRTQLRRARHRAGHGDRRQDGPRQGARRHHRRDRRGRARRQGRHHRLLHGRHLRLGRRGGAFRPVGVGRLLRRRHHRPQGFAAEDPDDAAFRREGRSHSGRRGEGSRRAASRRADLSLSGGAWLPLRRARAATTPTSAKLAWSRTLPFFAEHLR